MTPLPYLRDPFLPILLCIRIRGFLYKGKYGNFNSKLQMSMTTPAKLQTFLDSRLGLRRPCEDHDCMDRSTCGHPCCFDGLPLSQTGNGSQTPVTRTSPNSASFECKARFIYFPYFYVSIIQFPLLLQIPLNVSITIRPDSTNSQSQSFSDRFRIISLADSRSCLLAGTNLFGMSLVQTKGVLIPSEWD